MTSDSSKIMHVEPNRLVRNSQKQSVSIIIPTFNEEYGIKQVLNLIPYQKLNVSEVLVVDGGSSDGTVEIAKSFDTIVVEQTKPGYERAYFAGITHARGDILVFIDGDGVYDPREIPRLLEIMKKENADLVIGSRFRGMIMPGTLPISRLIGNKLITYSLQMLFGIRISDAFSGFLVIKKKKVPNIDRFLKGKQTPANVRFALIVSIQDSNGKIVEAPVTFYPRRGKSKLNSFSYGFKVLFGLLKQSLKESPREG